jgi:hypothetical protein
MKHYDSRLYSLAEEWARLRQTAEAERDPNKLMAIVDRLRLLLSEAEQLVCFNDECSSQDAEPAPTGVAVVGHTAAGFPTQREAIRRSER